jgi:hypothetical protein
MKHSPNTYMSKTIPHPNPKTFLCFPSLKLGVLNPPISLTPNYSLMCREMVEEWPFSRKSDRVKR